VAVQAGRNGQRWGGNCADCVAYKCMCKFHKLGCSFGAGGECCDCFCCRVGLLRGALHALLVQLDAH
jgi:hypothetical protein